MRQSRNGTAFLGVDLGTQTVRALAVSPSGDVLAGAAEPLASHRDGVRHEQDPERWWAAAAAACSLTMADLDGRPIEAMAVCATAGTIALVDAAGAPLTPGLMYDDGRAAAEAQRANDEGAVVWEQLGYRIGASWALPKLMWLVREHRPGRGVRLAHQADFVVRRLVGHGVPSDSSHALKTGYDVLRGCWPAEVIGALGIPDGILPEVVAPGTELGSVCRQAAEATGITAGTLVIAGMTDGCAAQLATGALTVGSWSSVLGTTLVLKGVSAQPVRDGHGTVYSHRSPDGHWLPGGASSVGAGILSERFGGRDLRALDRRATDWEPASAVAYPLVGRGERFPFVAPDAVRFTLGTPREEADEFAALLQGVAYVERLCFDRLDRIGAPTYGPLSLTGGGARSQLRADVLERDVRLPEHAEPAFGMAVLAASRGHRLADAAASMVRVNDVIKPRPGRAERFRAPYLKLVDELEQRGWLDEDLARHARARASA